MKNPLIIGNWKLNGNINIIQKLIKNLINQLNKTIYCKVAIAPPIVYLPIVKNLLKKSKIEICSQNVDINISGSYTGDISARMLKDIGVKYIIIGHSERRIHHNESDELIALKFKITKSEQLIPIICIGETEEEYKNGNIEQSCIRQIDIILKKFDISSFKNTVIAYEPIWAIGTGNLPKPKQIQIIHHFIRNYISKFNLSVSKKIIIQYGGSVNINNALDLLSQPDVDGLLIGKDSMNINNFSKIINNIKN